MVASEAAAITQERKPLEGENQCRLTGKVSKPLMVKYTPSGKATGEFIIAVPQKTADKESVAHIPVVLMGEAAEEWAPKLRIGFRVQLEGEIWSRTFSNRQGVRVTEIKVLAKKIGGDLGREN